MRCFQSSPKLSDENPDYRSPGRCQHCGKVSKSKTWDDLERWIEHDHHDSPTSTLVFLCEKCAEKVIPSSPRQYRKLSHFSPAGGSCPICLDCKWLKQVSCGAPYALCNGGPGITMKTKTASVTKVRKPDGSIIGYIHNAFPCDCSGKLTASPEQPSL